MGIAGSDIARCWVTPVGAQPLPTVRFRDIREHGGHQDRAWEELAFQLAGDMEQLPPDAVWERRGTPDGGLEFSCVFQRGGRRERWAWQAKYLFRLTSSEFGQMGDSFKDAITNEPDITRYLFILPINRPAGTVGTSSLKKWEDYVADWLKLARDRGIEVRIEYRGESEVMQALTLAKNAGALRYFFDDTFLGPKVCAAIVNRAIVNLGDRYEPDTDVGSRIDDVLDAAVLSHRFVDQLGQVLRKASEDAGTYANTVDRAGVDSALIRAAAAQFTGGRDAAHLRLSNALAPDFARLAGGASDLIKRLEPMDRIRELSDASVPFGFDVHALFFSANAVGIETTMHQRLADRRVNRVNQRREFFYATPAEAKELLSQLTGEMLQFEEFAEATEFRQSRDEAPALL